jgi:hypothetical protein
MIVTEKIDGTNAQVAIFTDPELEDGSREYVLAAQDGMNLLAASRSRYIDLKNDNMGFARWVYEHRADLFALGPGRHYGEWWGAGIQRKYNTREKRLSLFNVNRWGPHRDVVKYPVDAPACVGTVPVLYAGLFDLQQVEKCLDLLREGGSMAAPGFMQPEGVIVYHVAGGYLFKKTLDGDAAKGT